MRRIARTSVALTTCIGPTGAEAFGTWSGSNHRMRIRFLTRELVAFRPNKSTVENALARAIEGAVSAERWDVVAQLAKELEARRLAAVGVMHMTDERANRAPSK